MFFSDAYPIDIAARNAAQNRMVKASSLEEWTIAYKEFRLNGGML